jgi:hypothetical protein
MQLSEIVEKVTALGLPDGSHIVYGSGPMAAAGIREANDIDMLVSPALFEQLKQDGWQIRNKGLNDNPLVLGDFEAHQSWSFSDYSPSLEHLLASATVVECVPFAALEEVRKWKAANPTEKSQRDIELIDQYLASHQS